MSRALTGIRPTGDLTIANYVGGMQPIVEMQETYDGEVNVFVADVHGLTDQEPGTINANRLDTARSLLAAGVDPDITTVYLQSQIEPETQVLASVLERHVTVAELLRIPTLKEKIRDGDPEAANVALLRYPTLMAADICIQDALDVPVGKDQEPHIELTRRVARRFNRQYGDGEAILVEPNMSTVDGIRIAGLDGSGKMSKSNPRSAIFLKDTPKEVEAKVRKAQTAPEGEMTPALESHFVLAGVLASDDEIEALEDIKGRHLGGEQVMGEFKALLAGQICRTLVEFQDRYNDLSDAEVRGVLIDGSEKARTQATDVVMRVKGAMGMVDLF